VLCEPGFEEVFQFSRSTFTRHQWCAVETHLPDPDLAARLAGAAEAIPISAALQDLVSLAFGRALASPSGNGPIFRHLGLAALETFLADRAMEGRDAARHTLPLQKARRALHEALAGEWTLATLAARAGVSSNHLIKLFREHLGTTPMEYLWQLRLGHAAVLLRETGLGVAEIAYQTGFQNPFHFSRRFRQRFRQSPRQHRERLAVSHRTSGLLPDIR